MTFTRAILSGCLCLSLQIIQCNLSAQDTLAGNKIDPSAVLLPRIELKGTTQFMFATLMQTAGLSGGIATVQDDCTHGHEGTFSLPAGTSLAEALNSIARQKGLTWQINDNVINMSPSAGIPLLLQMPVSSFEWSRTASVGATIARLNSTQEISWKGRSLGVQRGVFEGGLSSICIRNCPTPAEQTIERETNIPLVTLLNHVTSGHKGAVWGYSEYRCHDERNFVLTALAQ